MKINELDANKIIWKAFAIDTYLEINNNKNDLLDENKTEKYQKLFNSFYEVRRCKQWRKPFYEIFAIALNDKTIHDKNNVKKIFKKYFDEVKNKCFVKDKSTEEYTKTQYEVSFVSKMLHTIEPSLFPIYDNRVATSISIKKIAGEDSFKMYDDLLEKYQSYLNEKDGVAAKALEKIKTILKKAHPEEFEQLTDYKLLDILFYN